MTGLLDKILRAGEGKTLRRLQAIVEQVSALEPAFEDMSDEELKEETGRFKERLAEGESLDDLLPEAFAVVREAAKRTLGQRHFDVQIMGGAALHQGNIAEMKTGEGKTLVATLPAYLNALSGKGVHIVTVNDYLASYQSELMGRVFRFLGLTTGCILVGQTPAERRREYGCDITYGTNNEFGFDYLRDNMAWKAEDLVQREHNFVIVDEVDSILIDEARTPLIISGPAQGDANKWYAEFAQVARRLKRDQDYEVDEKKRTVGILEPGIEAVEDHLGIENLYESVNTPLIGFLNNAVRAKELFHRDKDYVVLHGEVLIVDEHTGRVLPGRRYNEGMHQAIEAKEGVEIKAENQTLATITLQNYFRLYDKLSGMTGTAETEAAEFASTYKIGVVPIPTNQPMIREDKADLVYKAESGKWEAVVEDIAVRHAKGQPVLVGTVSVEKSEHLSSLLKKRGIPHQVLNAKQHRREASVVAEAGRKGAITVATNMAGRGTDIMLGGNAEFRAVQSLAEQGLDPEADPTGYEAAWPDALETEKQSVAEEHDEVVALGGLYVLGTERHESRRIDNQLRGRSGRQGDPGESRFYLSLEDELMRRFNSQLTERVMTMTGFPDDMPLESKLVTRGIASAQAQVESTNFEIRKNVLKYDDVMNRQRTVVYEVRRAILHGEDMEGRVGTFLDDVVKAFIEEATQQEAPEDWDLDALFAQLKSVFPASVTPEDLIGEAGSKRALNADMLEHELTADAHLAYNLREERLGSETMRELERRVLLAVLDRKWRDHLYEMDYLKEGIGLRAMAQRDPLVEYQREGYHMFQAMNDAIKEETVGFLFNIEVRVEGEEETPAEPGAQAAPADPAAPAKTKGQPEAKAKRPAGGKKQTQGGGKAAPGAGKKAAASNANRAEGGGPRIVAKGLDGPAGQAPLQYSAPSEDGGDQPVVRRAAATATKQSAQEAYPGTGRNQPCPCGSGKKYKMCHGKGF
ncbi:MAG: preprotein translocase subunit SecA [Bifidobacteriaceae bacterium]|nr:preprotein translocase subunit SecA [Bifidobacteriaceae bacterium]